MAKLTIDGKEIEVPDGTSLFDACREARGSALPHFCYHPDLSIAGVCRLCQVEVEGMPKLTIARDSAIWFTPRNAGHSGGYGGSASVLYPDKDNIRTLAAEYADISTENLLKYYKGPPGPKVTGGVEKISLCGAQNAGDFVAMMGRDDDLTACKGTTGLDVFE